MPPTLTASELKEIFHYDPETGEWFRFVNRGRKSNIGPYSTKPHGRLGYCFFGVNMRLYAAHRLAWLYVYGEWPKADIDHINGVKTDNRIANLRESNALENNQNRIPCKSKNRTGAAGVTAMPSGRFQAKIKANKQHVYLGTFDTIEDAESAYMKAKLALHKPFATGIGSEQTTAICGALIETAKVRKP